MLSEVTGGEGQMQNHLLCVICKIYDKGEINRQKPYYLYFADKRTVVIRTVYCLIILIKTSVFVLKFKYFMTKCFETDISNCIKMEHLTYSLC